MKSMVLSRFSCDIARAVLAGRRQRRTLACVGRPLLVPLVMAALAVAAGCGGESGGEERSERPSPQLVERLRDGGYVLAFRHAATDSGMDTTDDLSDCSRQRN